MRIGIVLLAMLLSVSALAQDAADVRLKEIARVEGVRDNPLIGYSLVVGLSGSGDTSKNQATLQSIANLLSHFGVNVSTRDLSSRNVAAVMVTASLPAFAEPGEKLDVEVSSLGDARSLSGGTLLLAPLDGPDHHLYALAQGSILVGGYQVSSYGSMERKNYPTVGRIPGGATVEQSAPLGVASKGRDLTIYLNQPDFTTAERVTTALRDALPSAKVQALNAGKIRIRLPAVPRSMVGLIAQVESVRVRPDEIASVVVNERTGTVVAGGDVRLGSVTISQGDLRISIHTDYQVSQPEGLYVRPSAGIQSVVVPHSDIRVHEPQVRMVSIPEGATVADLISALQSIHVSTRDVISILQSIKTAGALHARLIIQ